ncbi:uncharacterized protein [Miscanthus floridulus]|uniref:uncharacterized protein isoform X2 n=1 Tax=Miscanthus floridulus TaxID=154761 RepID=UPI0034584D00
MGNNETCKKSHEHEKLDIGRREEDKASYSPELEEGEFRKDEPFGLENLIHKGMVVSVQKLGSSTKGRVSTWQSTSPERGSHQGDTSMKSQLVNVIQSTCHRIYSEKHSQSYSPSSPIRSKERHEKRMRNCFSYHDYHQVLKKIEKVCSERLDNQLLHQSKDRKEFNTLIKEEEWKFFKKHACSYRVHYERVIPTTSYHRMKLPKLFFSILLKVFRKYMRSQLIKFVRRQINDRNKEKRIRERWIFEATAGYLKKTFDGTSMTCSGFKMEKPECHVHAYSEGKQELKFLDMQSLTTEIEAIASSKELEETVTDKDSDIFQPEPIIENLQSPIETNGGAEDGLSVDATEGLVDSMSSHSNNAPTEFSEKVGMQVAVSSPPQNEGGNVERSCSRFVTDKTLVLSKAVAADLGNEPPVRKKQRCMNPDDDALEGSCSGSQRNLPHESDSNIHETALHDEEEPKAERLPSANVNQMEQADVAANKEVSSGANSSFGQVTEQHNITATSATLVQPSTQLQLYDLTCQNVAHPCQESGVNTCSISTGLDNHGTLNIQQQSANQTSSMVEHMPENGLQSDPVTNGCRQLLMSSNRTSPPVRVTEQQISTSPPVQVTEQQNASNSSLLTPHVRQLCGPQTCQTVAHQDQPVGRNSFPAQAWLDSPRSSNVQQQSNNQTTTGSTSGQYMLESGTQSDPLAIEMSRLLLMHDLMTKKHISKRQKIILECEKELAECKRKFDEKFHNLEMETLQKKKDIAILEDKISKQQMLGETFQVLHKASAGVASGSQRGLVVT